MNREAISIAKLAGVITAIFILISLSIESNSTGIHFHDTYIVINSATKLILFIVLSVFSGSLLGAIISKFRNKLYNRMLIFSTLLLFSAGIYLMSIFAKLN